MKLRWTDTRTGRQREGQIVARSVCGDGSPLTYVRAGRWTCGVSRHNATDIAEAGQ